METIRTCPKCQQSLSADAPDGLCPQCLMKAASGPPPSAVTEGLPGAVTDIGDPAEIAKKLPQFKILEMLGRGGMGVVYKARQLNLDRIVALKILPPMDAHSADFVARFTREARSLAKLNHPNIVNVYDFGETGGLYYIVMEYVDGANLRQLYAARKLPPAEALAIVPKICDALQYAHEEGLVHRDIKPENLLIDKKGRVKIADFGLAKLLRREALDMTLTLSGMALGTLRYMAPEQMDKPESVDHRADLYSLGVVIYEMLTGETPVGRFELPSQKAEVDVRLDQIVLHALEREPERRYQHASEVRDDVEKVTSIPQAKIIASGRKSQIRAWLFASCLLGIVGCAWPCSIVTRGFFAWTGQSEIDHDGVSVNGDVGDSPARKAGVEESDTILSFAGREAHLNEADDPNKVWERTPAGTDIEIKVKRGGKEIVLHTVRAPDPLVARLYALWQFIAGFSLILFIFFVLIGPPFPRSAPRCGLRAILLGFGALTLMYFSDQKELLNPAKVVWGRMPVGSFVEWVDFWQKLAVWVSALALVLVGVLDIRRVFDPLKPESNPRSGSKPRVHK